MKAKKLMIFMVMAMLVAFSAACGTKGSSKGSSSTSGGSSNLSGKIVAGGSTALQPLAAAAAQTFQKKNPKAQVSVQGGGSGTGLSQVAAGNFDIGDSDIFKEQKSGLKNASKLVDHKVCVVGMAPVVNPAAGVTNLSQSDLIKIWEGKITNWKQVGGKDVKITLINRPEGSGTRATFTQFAIKGNKPTTAGKTLKQDSNGTVKKMIENTQGGMGYLAFSYLNGGKIQPVSINGVKPTAANIETNKWKVWAYEHMYTNGKAKGVAKAFLKYMMSSNEVQKNLVKKQGYIPITAMKVTRDAQGNVTNK